MELIGTSLALIGKLRRQLGLTQKELARKAGVSQSLIAKVESGLIDPAYSKVVQLFQALELELHTQENVLHAKDIMTISPLFVSLFPMHWLIEILLCLLNHCRLGTAFLFSTSRRLSHSKYR